MTIDASIKQNYRDLHESTGESYESIAGRAEAQNDPQLAAWLRSQAKAGSGPTEDESRTAPPQGRTAAKQETAAAEAAAKEAAEREAAEKAAAEAAEKAAAEAAEKAAAGQKAPVKK